MKSDMYGISKANYILCYISTPSAVYIVSVISKMLFSRLDFSQAVSKVGANIE